MTIREINASIEEGEALKDISAAYTEIASLKLKKLRMEVFRSRAFFKEILNIYALVRKMAKNNSINQKKSSKKAAVVLTSNNKFYGAMDRGVIDLFLNDIKLKKPELDVFVIGHVGIQTMKALKFSNFTPIEFRRDLPDPAELVGLTTRVKNYSQVLVYYAEFETVVKQMPISVDITQMQSEAISEKLSQVKEKSQDSYIFEPEASKILAFFDSQIKQILIGETFLEIELARTGSRLILMDQAQQNADEYLDEQHVLLLKAKRSIENARILELVASMNKII